MSHQGVQPFGIHLDNHPLDPEKLSAIGLNVPTAARIAALLREKGLPVRPGVCRMDDLRDAILEVCPHGN